MEEIKKEEQDGESCDGEPCFACKDVCDIEDNILTDLLKQHIESYSQINWRMLTVSGLIGSLPEQLIVAS